MRIFTRKGDGGATRLLTGEKVDKDTRRVKAYGELDELRCHMGVIRAEGVWVDGDTLLQGVQEDIFWMCSELAVAPGKPLNQPRRV
jgi:cob(I)alamin adenosyltransferase